MSSKQETMKQNGGHFRIQQTDKTCLKEVETLATGARGLKIHFISIAELARTKSMKLSTQVFGFGSHNNNYYYYLY